MNPPLESALTLVRTALVRTKQLLGSRPSPRDGSALSGLELLVEAFSLSDFERDLVVLCSAFELDAELAESGLLPSFSLALAVLDDPAWSALVPSATLRRRAIVELARDGRVLNSPLILSESVLHFLAGIAALDVKVSTIADLWPPPAAELDSEDSAIVDGLPLARPGFPLVLECEELGRGALLARCAAVRAGARVLRVQADRLPAGASDLRLLAARVGRDANLLQAWLVVEVADGGGGAVPQLLDLGELGDCPLVVVCRTGSDCGPRAALRVHVPVRSHACRIRRIRQRMGPLESDSQTDRIAAQFSLRDEELDAAMATARRECGIDAPGLWEACRAQAREATDGLVERVETRASLADLVLEPSSASQVRDIIGAHRHRARVLHDWGFDFEARGRSLTALFAGPSGTGKTLAAEVIAGELRVDLLRIDLSQVVSKYIGETEKHLRRVFDMAERSGAVLLFDEADALFGKRSEVRDSHDRYANIEVGYLLQKLESYRGVAILTTNMRAALDEAFLRRIRFLVEFSAPDEAARERIWRTVFPKNAPVSELAYGRLARLRATGGAIRSIAVAAAYLAAAAGSPITMEHIELSARREARKLNLPEGSFSVLPGPN